MRIAFLSDMHANREAFEACLAHLRTQPHDRIALLGDIVGYGADPVACAEIAADMVAKGAICLRGNHDAALGDPDPDMNRDALAAIRWTERQLAPERAEWLRGLPLSARIEDVLLVHAAANHPDAWHYVTNGEEATRSLAATDARVVVSGHTHVPMLFSLQPNGKAVGMAPRSGVPLPLSRHRRWQVVLGSVGQPRDRNPAAAYAILDQAQGEITFHRVGYDTAGAAAKILSAGLPHKLAYRLALGT